MQINEFIEETTKWIKKYDGLFVHKEKKFPSVFYGINWWDNSFLYWLGGRDRVELLNLVYDIFNNKDTEFFDMLFPDGMK